MVLISFTTGPPETLAMVLSVVLTAVVLALDTPSTDLTVLLIEVMMGMLTEEQTGGITGALHTVALA